MYGGSVLISDVAPRLNPAYAALKSGATTRLGDQGMKSIASNYSKGMWGGTLQCRPAAIHHEVCPGYILRGVRRQIDNRALDVFIIEHSPQGHALAVVLQERLRLIIEIAAG